MSEVIFNDLFNGTKIEFNAKTDETIVTVAQVPFSKLTMRLDRTEVEALLAVREHSADPVFDVAEHFGFVYHATVSAQMRAAEAFVGCAGNIAHRYGI